MQRSLRMFGPLSLFVFLMGGAAAHAETFTFTATGTFFNASGSLTAITNPGHPNVLEVTSISGTANGEAITGLCATTDPSPACASSGLLYDDLLYSDGNLGVSTQRLDFEGIAVTLGTGGLVGDFSAASTHTDVFSYSNERGAATPILIDFSVTPTPEPGSLALLGTGLLGIAGKLRRHLRS